MTGQSQLERGPGRQAVQRRADGTVRAWLGGDARDWIRAICDHVRHHRLLEDPGAEPERRLCGDCGA